MQRKISRFLATLAMSPLVLSAMEKAYGPETAQKESNSNLAVERQDEEKKNSKPLRKAIHAIEGTSYHFINVPSATCQEIAHFGVALYLKNDLIDIQQVDFMQFVCSAYPGLGRSVCEGDNFYNGKTYPNSTKIGGLLKASGQCYIVTGKQKEQPQKNFTLTPPPKTQQEIHPPFVQKHESAEKADEVLIQIPNGIPLKKEAIYCLTYKKKTFIKMRMTGMNCTLTIHTGLWQSNLVLEKMTPEYSELLSQFGQILTPSLAIERFIEEITPLSPSRKKVYKRLEALCILLNKDLDTDDYFWGLTQNT